MLFYGIILIILFFLLYILCKTVSESQYSHYKIKFISYTSSKLEMEWMKIISDNENNYTDKYCSLIKPFDNRLEILQRDILVCKNNTYHKCKGDDLSFFTYKNKNGKLLREFIEPLFGILRNTFSICSNNSKGHILSKDYLLPSYINALNKQIVYLDAGASTFYNGPGGSSQNYFYEFYKKYPSVKFQKWYLWEVKRQNISNMMKEIPYDIVNIYNYYNKPIVTDINSNDNPLKIVKRHQNNSYIIFKLDVDNPKVEIPILNYLIMNNDIFPDEFFFEYHYYSQINKWWGKLVDYSCSLLCATNKFLLLRKKGIRSHPWI